MPTYFNSRCWLPKWICAVIHHLSFLSGLPAFSDLYLKKKHGASGTWIPEAVGGALCSSWGCTTFLSAPYVHTDAASSNSETQTRCLVGWTSQSMSSPFRPGSALFSSICFLCLANLVLDSLAVDFAAFSSQSALNLHFAFISLHFH